MIEKEELRGRINKILRDEIGRELLDMTADKIIDMLFSENLPNPPEPRVGQICEFWDEVGKGLLSILSRVNKTSDFRYLDQADEWWKHARVCRDPLTLGRTLAPEGAEWIAPISQDVWAFYNERPSMDGDGFYFGNSIRNAHQFIPTYPAPTDGCEPIKLWED